MAQSKYDEIVEYYNKQKQLRMNNKEQFLIELEQKFDNSSWEDVMVVVNEAINTHISDPVVESIIQYVHETNRISFKQWKVLRYHINLCNKKNKKYKYGN
jgi:hypothetical protein